MTDHDRPDAPFEPEVRTAFRRHLAELDRLVPARPPAVSWSDRAEVEGKVARRSVDWDATRPRRATAPQLAGALAGVLAFAVIALIANVALRAVLPAPAAGPTPVTLQPFEVRYMKNGELTALVMGTDAYVLDATDRTVYRGRYRETA
jgi:hypothetical protein